MAASQKYKVILKSITDEKTKEIIQRKLAVLTKRPESVIASIVAKAPIVIFKSLDTEKTRMVKKHFGDVVTIEAISLSAEPETVAKPTEIASSDEKHRPAASRPEAESSKMSASLGFADEKPASGFGTDKSIAKPDMLMTEENLPKRKAEKESPKPAPPPKPVKKKGFRDKYVDQSDDNGYAYDFFCEKCKKSYRPNYFTIPSGVGYNISAYFKWLGLKLSGKTSSDFPTMKEEQKKSFQKSSFNKALKMAEEHFLKCNQCGKRVCGSCWNTSQKKCAGCAPLTHGDLPEYMRKKIEKEKREKESKAKSRFCPGCGSEKEDGAKFCEVCGASYE